jgi:hypothetical protein
MAAVCPKCFTSFAIWRVLSWVPVERKCRGASFSFAAGSAESDDAGPPDLEPERFAASLLSKRRRAIRSMIMFVIIALAGLFQLPPSRSEYCAADGAHTTSTNSIKKRPRLDCELFLLI